jgi:hypothetical protein
LIQLPKGQFKVSFESRLRPVEAPSPARRTGQGAGFTGWRRVVLGMGVVLLAVLAWGGYATVRLKQERQVSAPIRAAWTPELEELWRPILATNRPLIVAVAAPLFVGLQGKGMFRDLSLNRWEDVAKSPKIGAIQRALDNPPLVPRYYYTAVGVTSAVFQLGRFLAIGQARISIARSSQLNWQQLADNNVLCVGASRVFWEQLAGLPVELEVVLDETGVRILHPRAGEPATFADTYPSIMADPPASVRDDGVLHAVITHTPGPLGTGDIVSFNCNHSPGTAAAVQSFTSPSLARTITAKMRKPSGELPRYYQVVLRVKYQDSVPTEVAYVLHRELQPERRPAAAGK